MRKLLLTIPMILIVIGIAAAQTQVKGYVIDENNDPLIGVNILVEGTASGTITDASGNFALTIPEQATNLVFSYTGYASQIVPISGDNYQIVLLEDVTVLDGVTVSGFIGAVGQARRRAESTQKIPESVVTLTSDQINTTGVNNIQSFATLVPNVSFQTSQNPGVNFINVRGIAQIRNGESPVAFVIDGVTIPDANLLNQDLYDLAMIEVVKGPQGTLYGKNAIGGAINIITNPATNYTKNKLTLGYGNGNSLSAQLSSSGALSPDKVYYRISGSYKNSDGVIDNVTLNEPVDFNKSLSIRGQLKFDVSPKFNATVMGQYADQEGGATYYAHSPNGLQLDANDFDNVINADQRGTGILKNTFLALKMEWNLGKSIFKSVTSYNDAERDYSGDLDFLPVDILRQNQISNSSSFNQEFRLSSANNDNKVSWDLGGFYQSSDKLLDSRASADFGFFAMPAAPTGMQSPLAQLTDFNNKFSTIALFGFLDYELSDQFTASFGLRYDSDKIDQDNRLLNTTPSKTQSELQPKVSISYQANDKVLLFANYGRGYRSGGFNSDVTASFGAEYDGETSNNFEIGLKSSSKDDRFIFNAGAFYTKFKNQQQYVVSINTSGALLIGNYNLPETNVSGFEADIKYRASKSLDILAGFGYNASEIVDGGNAGGLDRSAFNGNTTPFVPQTTFNIALQSKLASSEKIDIVGFVNLSNKGKINWHEDNIDQSDPFSLLDARITFDLGKLGFAIWGNNILDAQYYQEYFAGEISGSAAGDIGWVGKPTTYGVDVSVNF